MHLVLSRHAADIMLQISHASAAYPRPLNYVWCGSTADEPSEVV